MKIKKRKKRKPLKTNVDNHCINYNYTYLFKRLITIRAVNLLKNNFRFIYPIQIHINSH